MDASKEDWLWNYCNWLCLKLCPELPSLSQTTHRKCFLWIEIRFSQRFILSLALDGANWNPLRWLQILKIVLETKVLQLWFHLHNSKSEMVYIGICHALLNWFGDIVSNRWYSKNSILISFFGDVAEPILVSFSQVVVRAHFILIGFSLDALACIPIVTLHFDPKDSIGRELFLAQVHPLSKFIVFFIKEILEMALHENSFGHGLVVGFRHHYLLHFIVNWIFLDLPKAKVRWIYWPVIRTHLLFSRVVVLVRFQIHFSDLFLFGHIFSRVNGLFGSVLILLSGKPKLKLLLLCLRGEFIISVDGLGKRLPWWRWKYLFRLSYLLSLRSLIKLPILPFSPAFMTLPAPSDFSVGTP